VRFASLAVLLALLAAPATARAYCRASTCDGENNEGARCMPKQGTDCGKALRWKRDCVGIAVQKDASSEVAYPVAKGTVRAAFEAWEDSGCGESGPGFHVEILNKVECGQVEYNTDGANVNVLVFRDEAWPHEGAHNIALTTVTFDVDTAEIYDADIEVNTSTFDLTVSNDPDATDKDLLAVLTHEAGHFLGLAHSDVEGATMNAVYNDDQPFAFRSVESDDQLGVCDAYPPKELGECNPIPRHGFSSACMDSQTDATCSVAPGGAPSDSALAAAMAAAVAALGGGLVWRRARRNRARAARTS
jgi:hypothetical protein